MKPRKRRRKLPAMCFASNAVMLDPLHSRSLVGYNIGRSRYGYIAGDVRLMDCDRQVIWRLDHAVGFDGAAKLNAAIRVLTEARDAWLDATDGVRPKR